MSEHADIEALSAYVDGEAPEVADHVAGCAECRATADQLRAVSAAVAAPVEPAPAGAREAAIAMAVGTATAAAAAAEAGAGDVRPFRRGRRSSPVAIAAVAAALLAFVLGSTLLLTYGTRSSGNRTTTAAGPLKEAAPSQPGAADSAAAPATDLGDVPDAGALLDRTRGALSASRAAGGAGGAASAAVSPAAAGTSPVAGPSGDAAAVAPTPATVGTRPCEEQARARQPSLGPVVYFATARRHGVPAVVLGFSNGPGSGQVTLLLLAQNGCAELLRAVGP